MKKKKNIFMCWYILLFLLIIGCTSGNYTEKLLNVEENPLDNSSSNNDIDYEDNDTDTDLEEIQYKDLSFEYRVRSILGETPKEFSYDKKYKDWLEMYSSMAYSNGVVHDTVYYVAYIDDDDIPEFISYWKNYNITTWNSEEKYQIIGEGMAYSARLGRILSLEEKDDGYYVVGYTYEYGNLRQDIIVKENSEGNYSVLNCSVDKESYDLINDFINLDEMTVLTYDNCYSQEEIISVLKTGHDSSFSHRYEVIYDDVSWQKAEEMCKNMGGYLAVITSKEELFRVKKLITDQNDLSVFYIGCKGRGLDKRWYLKDNFTMEVGGGNIYVSEFDNNSMFSNLGIDYKKEKMEYGFLVYGKPNIDTQEEKQIKMFLGPKNMIDSNPSLNGKTGFICEYDE